MRHFLLIAFLLVCNFATAQKILVLGQVNDSTSKTSIPLATVSLKSDSFQTTVTTNPNGYFSISVDKKGSYQLEISFLSYKKYQTQITVADGNVKLGKIFLQPEDLSLNEVEIVGHNIPVAQKGDTTEMSANAYKVNVDADALELVKKMPGVTIENGEVKAHGENVKKVLVDGKDYFGTDAALSLQNLPAEMIDKVQIYNKLSDQSEFIGFDDGNSDKVMNIVTRGDRKVGQNGKFLAGFGLNENYQVNGRWNFSNKKNNLTVLGGSNNVNQQNFSMQDDGGRGDRTSGFSRMTGLNTTHSVGTNYSGNFNNKLNISASYFFNAQDNFTDRNSDKSFFGEIDTLKRARYEEQDEIINRNNGNHRLNAFIEYKIDTLNSISYRQSLSFRQTDQTSDINSNKYNQISNPLLVSLNQSLTESDGFNFSGNLVFRHKFLKKGRTISLGLQFANNLQNNDNLNISTTQSFSDVVNMNQSSITESTGKTYSTNIAYTEPINQSLLLMLSYNSDLNPGNSEKFVYDNTFDPPVKVDLISNALQSKYFAQRGGVTLLIQKGRDLNASIGLELQNADLSGEQTYPEFGSIDKTFKNILPNARINYKISKTKNIRASYRSSTNAPSISQLQPVISISNPTSFYLGNPNLVPSYNQSFHTNYKYANPEKFTNFVFNVSGSYTLDPIGNETLIMDKDTIISGQTLLQNGQLITLANLPDSWNTRSFFNYGFLFKPIKCNINLMAGGGYSTIPGFVNRELGLTKSVNIMEGIVIASNISKYIDFTVSYNGNYTMSRNTIESRLNSNIWLHIIGLGSTLTTKNGFLLTNSLSEQINTGLSGNYNQNYLIWNLTFGKKIFKNKNGQIAVQVNDLLDQNKDVSRSVTDYYVSDSWSNTIGRYGLVTFSYTFKSYNAKNNPENNSDFRNRFDGPMGRDHFH